MALTFTASEKAMIEGAAGPAKAMALRIVAGAAAMLGAQRLVPVVSAHADGCLYHGDSGTLFAERLANEGGKVAVPTTLNVGSLDLFQGGCVRLGGHETSMARRMMEAYAALGCQQTWTCAPYQAGHRPAKGEDVAWGESNAVVFCNSVLGARTNRYGDFLDICAAVTGLAPYTGLHRPENRRATLLVDTRGLNPKLVAEETFYPVLGAWLGQQAGQAVAAIQGLPRDVSEDRLKALGAAAASAGATGLFHVIGVTPEAPDLDTAFGHEPPRETIELMGSMLHERRLALSTTTAGAGQRIDGVALGSPHFSCGEFLTLLQLLAGRCVKVPLYACTGRHTIRKLEALDLLGAFKDAGVTIVADTCIAVTPILPEGKGLIMTNSGKFAHYTKPNTGWDVVFGSMSDCVASAIAGRLARDETLWC